MGHKLMKVDNGYGIYSTVVDEIIIYDDDLETLKKKYFEYRTKIFNIDFEQEWKRRLDRLGM